MVRLKERDEISTTLDHRDFGNIVHQALELLYQPLIGQTITKEIINDLLSSSRIEEAVELAINNHYRPQGSTRLEGKDILHEQVIQKLIFKAVESELRLAPMELIGTEMKVAVDMEIDEAKICSFGGPRLTKVYSARGNHSHY